jgi:hypothetical protein
MCATVARRSRPPLAQGNVRGPERAHLPVAARQERGVEHTAPPQLEPFVRPLVRPLALGRATQCPAGAVMVVAIVAVSIALVAFRQSMETIRLTW